MSKQTKIKLVTGKLYVLRSDVWAIDFQQSETHMQVYIRDQVFKVKEGDLIFLEGDKDE